jgi:protein CpxP
MIRQEVFPMTMKQTGMQGMRAAMLALCTLAMAVPAIAQDNGAPPPQTGGGRPDMAQMEARQLERMTRELNLTPDQVTQVKAINEAQRAQMMALRNDSTIPQEDKRGKMMAMRQETEGKIRAVLTEEQRPKYEAMLAEQRQRQGSRQGGPPPGQ